MKGCLTKGGRPGGAVTAGPAAMAGERKQKETVDG